MTNFKKRFAALALLGLMALGMSACSQKLPDSTNTSGLTDSTIEAQIA